MKIAGNERSIAINIRLITEKIEILRTLNRDESRNRLEMAAVARQIREAADQINTMAKVKVERRMADLGIAPQHVRWNG